MSSGLGPAYVGERLVTEAKGSAMSTTFPAESAEYRAAPDRFRDPRWVDSGALSRRLAEGILGPNWPRSPNTASEHAAVGASQGIRRFTGATDDRLKCEARNRTGDTTIFRVPANTSP